MAKEKIVKTYIIRIKQEKMRQARGRVTEKIERKEGRKREEE